MLPIRLIKSISSTRISGSFSVLSTNRYFSSNNLEDGTVKFYNRAKAYGFIDPDVDKSDIFVHRTNLVGAPTDDIFNPFLAKGERVKFRRVMKDGKLTAADVTLEDGSNIPLFRDNYMEKKVKAIKSSLGYKVYDIFSEGGDENSIAEKITDAFLSAKEKIAALEETAKSASPN